MHRQLLGAVLLSVLMSLTAVVAIAGFNDFSFNGFSMQGGGCFEQRPILDISPSSYTFANTTTGKSRSTLFTVTNTGKGILSNISTSKSSGVFKTYTAVGFSCNGKTLYTGNYCKFKVEYKPVSATLSRYSSMVSTGQFVARHVQVEGTGVAGAGACETIAKSATTNTLGLAATSSGNEYMGQVVDEAASSITACAISFYIRGKTGTTDSIQYRAGIYSRSGNNLSTLKGYVDVAGSSLPASGEYKFVLGSATTVVTGDVIVISRTDGGVDASNYINFAYTNSNVDSGYGHKATYYSNKARNVDSTTHDVYFKLWQ